MKKFIECKGKCYTGKEFYKYVDKQNSEDELDEADQWKKNLQNAEEVEPPKPHYGKVFVDPTNIAWYAESFSLEAINANPDKPKFDQVDLTFKDGVQIGVIGTIKEFNDKLDKFYAEI